jgi:acyl carrier protein
LRNFLKDRLPDYMIPSTFVILTALPLTPNGKVDRSALPAPEDRRPDLDTPYTVARTPIEEELAGIWADILSLDRVGIHDNFFDLGGHSLAATRVVSQVIKKFQLELPLRSLFQSPTIAEMAAVIEAYQEKKIGEADLEGMLAELESLSDEEARRLLAEESGKPSRGERRD